MDIEKQHCKRDLIKSHFTAETFIKLNPKIVQNMMPRQHIFTYFRVSGRKYRNMPFFVFYPLLEDVQTFSLFHQITASVQMCCSNGGT